MTCDYGCDYSDIRPCKLLELTLGDKLVSLCPFCGNCTGAEVKRIYGTRTAAGAPNFSRLHVLALDPGTGETYTFIAFEKNNEFVRPEGEVAFTLPEALRSETFSVVSGDGTEIPTEISDGALTVNFAPEGEEPLQYVLMKND